MPPEPLPSPPHWVFLCGTARGGTTLLARLLDGHPSLAVLPWDSRIYPDVMDRMVARALVTTADRSGWYELPGLLAMLPGPLVFGGRRALETRLARWMEDFPEPPERRIDIARRAAAGVRNKPGCWEAFFRVLGEVTGAAPGDRIRVEKTPYNERLVALLDRLFGPETRYVHIVRDPRAVLASWLRLRNLVGRERDRALLDRSVDWSRSVERLNHNLTRRRGRIHALRYEDLVEASVEVMTGVRVFLDLPPAATLATPTHLGRPIGANSSFGDASAATGVVASQVARFAEVLTEVEIARVGLLLGAQMEQCGYGAATDEGTCPALPPSLATSPRARMKVRELLRRQRRERRTPRPWSIPEGRDVRGRADPRGREVSR